MTKQLYRSCTNRILGGVCGGLGEYFDLDPVLFRLIIVLLAFGGVGIVLYLVGWVIIPSDPACAHKQSAAEEIREKANEAADRIRTEMKHHPRKDQDGRPVVGLIILLIGLIFLVQNIFNFNLWHNFWPVVLIIAGLAIIAGNLRKQS